MDSDHPSGESTVPEGVVGSLDACLEGRVLDGRYRIDYLLGTGGAGVVYRATDLNDDKPVALKILHEELRATGHTVSRFYREGKALAKLAHPHIVRVVGYGISDAIPYIAMEFLEGRTLEKMLEPAEPLDFDLSMTIARQMLQALAFAHRAKVVHRDLKPANIFLEQHEDNRCHIKLLDFGLAKFLAPDDHSAGHTLTRTGVIMGTPLYMAPEQAIGGKIDVRVDVYAAGSVIFEMLTGTPPFVVEEHHQLIKAHLLAPVPRLTEIGVGKAKDRGLEQLIEKAMAKEPAQRFSDAEEMLQALKRLGVRKGESRFRSVAMPRLFWSAGAVLALAALLYIGNEISRDRLAPKSDESSFVNRPPPRDLLHELGIPEQLASISQKIERNQIITNDDIKEVQSYASRNPRDARPFLLLAHGFANQRWRRDSISRYLRAYRIDQSCRGDPRMLSELLSYAAHHTYGEAACEAIREIYGNEARTAVERALTKAPKNSSYAKRLVQLIEHLRRDNDTNLEK
ncbi:MAG: serine/threonine protein kinase [Deltaproteobacteria bacterium]|nr:serine/threonine protein kinase [Deltaproteobacteria bacterium]